LSRLEWQLVALVLTASTPWTARQLTTRLGADYGTIKRTVRALVRWRILERASGGLVFQADADRWGPPP
jgi:hypothetical protein